MTEADARSVLSWRYDEPYDFYNNDPAVVDESVPELLDGPSWVVEDQNGALIGFFPVVINTAVGLTQVDPEMLDLGRVFNAPKWKVFAKIRIPNAYPYILSALKITATAAVVGAIVGEFVASQRGLGYVIITTQGSMNTPVAFAALVWISVVGLAVYGAVVLAARWIAPWAEISD